MNPTPSIKASVPTTERLLGREADRDSGSVVVVMRSRFVAMWPAMITIRSAEGQFAPADLRFRVDLGGGASSPRAKRCIRLISSGGIGVARLGPAAMKPAPA